MLNLTFRPHRAALKSGSTDEQKLFAMLKVMPKGEVAGARPPLAFALVIDTSGSMREFADQERAAAMVRSRGLNVQSQASGDGSGPAVDLSLPTKLDQAIQAAQTLINDARLNPDDNVAVIHFDDDAQSLLPLSPLSRKQAALQAVGFASQVLGRDSHCQGASGAQSASFPVFQAAWPSEFFFSPMVRRLMKRSAAPLRAALPSPTRRSSLLVWGLNTTKTCFGTWPR